MHNVSEKTKELYRRNAPEVKQIPHKSLELVFDNGVVVGNKIIHSGTFSLEESICEERNIKFGGCISSCFKIKLAGIEKDISGHRFTAIQKIDGGDDITYGTYTVDSAKLTDDRQHREIVAYDDIYWKLNTDVTEWYNNLAFPLNLKIFRQSLFSYVGIDIEEQELINDSVLIEKTIDTTYINGVDVAKAIGEINGAFGIIRKSGKFRYIELAGTGLYPSEDLYPSEELYPSEASAQFGTAGYIKTVYEEYDTSLIDCLEIKKEDGVIGSQSYNTRNFKNPYVIIGNFLVYGKTASELEVIGNRIFGKISGITYRPHTTKAVGLPYVEAGDSITLIKKNDNLQTYVFSRKISGGQVLTDEFSATGDLYQDNKVTPNVEIEILKNKELKIEKSVDGLEVAVSDLEENTASRFEQTASSIEMEVKRAIDAENELLASLKINENNIALKISKGDYSSIVSSINLDENGAKIQGDKIEITGNVNFKSVKSDVDGLSTGDTIIDGGCIQTGLVEAEYIDVKNLTAQNINCGSGYLQASKENVLLGGLKVWSNGASTYLGDVDDGDTFGMGSGKGSHFWSNWKGDGYYDGNGSAVFQVDKHGVVYAEDIFFDDVYGRTGDITVHNDMYIRDVYITGDDGFWRGWGMTDTIKDIYDRLEALEKAT